MGERKLEEGGQKLQTFNFQISVRDVMYNVMTVANTAL